MKFKTGSSCLLTESYLSEGNVYRLIAITRE